jgi:transposase-like protein
LESSPEHDSASIDGVSKEKRTQDWSHEERLDMVIACGALDEAAMNQLCRERRLYAHHVAQWKQDFISGLTANERADSKNLKGEVRELKRELNRKDRALAEIATLLALQKKSAQFGGTTRTAHDEHASTSDHR